MVRDDPSRDQAGYLPDQDRPMSPPDAHRHPLVELARLVQCGVDELAGTIIAVFNRPGYRVAVHMNVEDVHEHRDSGRFALEILRLVDLLNAHDSSVSRRNHQFVSSWSCPNRVAEEREDPNGHRRPCQCDPPTSVPVPGPSHEPGQDCKRDRCERYSLGGDSHGDLGNSSPVMRRYASRYRSLVTCTVSGDNDGGGEFPSHNPAPRKPSK